MLAHKIVVAADAARRDDHGVRAERELADDLARARLAARNRTRHEDIAIHTGHRAIRRCDGIHAMATPQRNLSARDAIAHSAYERCDDAGPRAPRDVEAWYRIAVAGREGAAPFGPPDDRKETHAARVQPRALFSRGKVDVRLGPPSRPRILIAIKPRGTEPIPHGKVARIANAKATLLG